MTTRALTSIVSYTDCFENSERGMWVLAGKTYKR